MKRRKTEQISIAERLRRSGTRQTEIAQKCGTTPSYVSLICSGAVRKGDTVATVRQFIASVLNIPYCELWED